MSEKPRLNLEEVRTKLEGKSGKEYWRSLEELADTEEFREFLHREFPREAAVWDETYGRRQFLTLMGASLALAGLNACTKQPDEKIVPYVRQPEIAPPGESLSFATAMVHGGYATGILATSHMGRPTKIEGNPTHPASLGATDIFAQASVLSLYDPDRSRVPVFRGNIGIRDRFLSDLDQTVRVQRSLKGSGLRILTETVTSPTLAHQLNEILREFPRARWHQYDPVTLDNVREGARIAFGQYVQTRYRFDKADVILSIDSDFLTNGSGAVRYARDFSGKRKVSGGKTRMSRLYAIESSPTNVGAVADHRLAVRSGEIGSMVRFVARALGVAVQGSAGEHQPWMDQAVTDLQAHRGSSIVVAGPYQPASVHALVHLINERLGNAGSTVEYSDSVESRPVDQLQSFRSLIQDIELGSVDTLIILGGNPVYSAPVDLDFAGALDSVRFSVHLGLYDNETAERCTWHIPQAHFLESWSDARSYDGTTTIIQPLITPLYRGVFSPHELLEEVLGRPGRKSHDITRDFWKTRYARPDFDRFWQEALHDGIVPNTMLPARPLRVTGSSVLVAAGTSSHVPGGVEIAFRPDPGIWDGQYANNAWLQELPKPLTTLTWDNAALISPSTAQAFGLDNEDIVELVSDGRSIEAPVWIMPGHPDRSVTVHLGYGQSRAGRVGSNRGFNAYLLRTSESPWFGACEIRKTDKRFRLAATQHHHSMEGRHLVRSATLTEFLANPSFAKEMGEVPPPSESLHPQHEYDGYAWGMSIDLSACTGCNACVIACQSENNIPTVGKDQVLNGREMHWIRIDRYYSGPIDNPETFFQPVTCMHCERAPCEVVCPVAATVHDSEGLNVMVYNRCIGTRYCSNNCPYKVRRFNFLQYSVEDEPTIAMQKNPDVTVRTRGVMEKCSYCVQRISSARITAKKEGRTIQDGEVVTACQAACPSQAIVFGDINDKQSTIARLKSDPLDYSLLAELNTKPRTTYLANVRNPNDTMTK